MRAAGHVSDYGLVFQNVIAVTRNSSFQKPEPDKCPAQAAAPHLLQGFQADEVSGIPRHEPVEPGLQRRHSRVHVRAVQQQAGLQPQHVARAESARRGSRVRQPVPYVRGVLAGERQFEAVLARVPRPAHHGRHSEDLRLPAPERPQFRQVRVAAGLQHGLRARPLQGDQGGLLRDDLHVHVDAPRITPASEPGQDLGGVGRVGNEQEPHVSEPVHDGVVDDAAGLVADEGVAGAPQGHACHVAGDKSMDERGGVRTGDLHSPHVRYVEDAGGGAHGPGLRQNALVLDGHLPPGELHQPRAGGGVAVIERRALEHGRRRCVLFCHLLLRAVEFVKPSSSILRRTGHKVNGW